MSNNINRIVLTALILISVLFVGISSANPEITVEAPSAPVNVGETISLPVILNNDMDFAGFMITVNNDIPGVTVAMQQDEPIEGGIYTYSENGKSSLKVLEFNTKPMTDSKIHLFTLDVTINDESVTNVPLTITLDEFISDSKGDIPLSTVKKVDLSGIKLTSGTSLSVKTEEGTKLLPVETATAASTVTTTPAAASTVTTTPAAAASVKQTSSVTVTSTQTEAAPSAKATAKQTAAKAKSPGFCIVSVLAALGAACVILCRRQNN